ncbi:Zn-ribbon domain-containing OB-fold protein [Chloroflexota bacterium]
MTKTRVPIREGYLTEEKEGASLLASKCRACGQVYFPPRDRCPECHGMDMEEVKLSRSARLYTYTVVHMPVHKYKPPFALAWVELPEGVRVFTQLKGWENAELKIGMDMKMIIDTLWEDEEKEVYGYKYEPVV